MTRDDYRRLRRVFLATREPELGRILLAHELRKRPSSPGEVVQLRLACVEVYCDAFEARLTVAECVRRQDASEPSGAGKGFKLNARCQTCPLRDIHRAMVPHYRAPKFRRFSIQREQRQRAARQRLWKSGALEPVRTIDGEE